MPAGVGGFILFHFVQSTKFHNAAALFHICEANISLLFLPQTLLGGIIVVRGGCYD